MKRVCRQIRPGVIRCSGSIVVKALNLDANNSDSGPVWSPSGDALAFEAQHTQHGGPGSTSSVQTAGGSGRWRVRDRRGVVTVGFTGRVPRNYELRLGPRLGAAPPVETVGTSGRHIRVLACPPSGSEVIWSGPVWARDGKRILVALGGNGPYVGLAETRQATCG